MVIVVVILGIVLYMLSYMRFQTTNEGSFKMTTDTWSGDIVLNPPNA